MTLSTLCNRSVVTIHRQATVEEVARLMRSSQIGAVVVVNAQDARVPVGIVTDRDIVIKVIAQGLPVSQTPVESVMSSPVLTLREDYVVFEALDKMSKRGVRRAPLVDREGQLRGLISTDDLVSLLARDLAKLGPLIVNGQAAEWSRMRPDQERIHNR